MVSVDDFRQYLTERTGLPGSLAEPWLREAQAQATSHDRTVRELVMEMRDYRDYAIDEVAFKWFSLRLSAAAAAILTSRGYTPTTYANARARLHVITPERPDHVLLGMDARFWASGIPDTRVLAYFDAYISFEEALAHWEPRATAGEVIEPALNMLAALQSSIPVL